MENEISEIFVEIERIKGQVNHLVATVESEKGTLQREADRLRDEIDRVEKKFFNVLYDEEKGLIVKQAILMHESKERKRMQRIIWSIVASVILLIIKAIFDLIKN